MNRKTWIKGAEYLLVFFFVAVMGNVSLSQNTKTGNTPKLLSDNDYQLFTSIALEKANYFFYLLNRIANKSTPKDSLNYYIHESDLLFHDSAVMEVKSSAGRITRRPIVEYLRKLSQLNYSQLKIEVFSAFFVSDLQYVSMKTVGNTKITEYEGIIAFEQLFEGKRGTEITYKDKTLKAMRVHVLITESDIGRSWDVLLGDILILASA